jgi:hypothetical protein
MKKTQVVIGGLILLGFLVGYVLWSMYQAGEAINGLVAPITSFDTCVAAGYAVQESNPARCVTPEGVVFTAVTDSGSSTTATTTETPTPDPDTAKTSFGTPVALAVGKTAVFEGGLTVTLKEVTDSRCPEDVMCVWAGEQGVLLAVSGGSVMALSEVRLAETMPALTQHGYTFTLGSVSDTGAKVTVTKAAVATGSISGTVTVGPICPVESIDNPCVVSPEVYTSRSVVVYQADTSTEIKRLSLSATGTYTLALTAGTYWLQISPAGIGEGDKKRVVVTTGSASVVDFDIDTGIR